MKWQSPESNKNINSCHWTSIKLAVSLTLDILIMNFTTKLFNPERSITLQNTDRSHDSSWRCKKWTKWSNSLQEGFLIPQNLQYKQVSEHSNHWWCWYEVHIGLEPSKTDQTRWEWHHNTFKPSLHLMPFLQLCFVLVICVWVRIG